MGLMNHCTNNRYEDYVYHRHNSKFIYVSHLDFVECGVHTMCAVVLYVQ